MNFKDFLGNERAKEYLSSSLARQSFPHALLITGERGIGKKTLANIISHALVCTGKERPCGECDSCCKAINKTHPDIIQLGDETAAVGVNDIRELKRDALLRPNDAERKVYIINNAGALTHQAQDALLKILEEPPAFTFFILLCYNYTDLLPTIVSRTAHISLSPLCDEDMKTIIRKKLPDIDENEADVLIRTSGGVCSFLSEKKDIAHTEHAFEIAKALATKDEFEIFRALSSLDKRDRDFFSGVSDELLIIIRDAIVLSSKASSKPISTSDGNAAKAISDAYTQRQCTELALSLSDARKLCSQNVGISHITGALTCKFAYTAANAALKG